MWITIRDIYIELSVYIVQAEPQQYNANYVNPPMMGIQTPLRMSLKYLKVKQVLFFCLWSIFNIKTSKQKERKAN